MRLAVATVVLGAVLATAMVAGAAVHDTTLVSAGPAGTQADGSSGPGVAVSSSGQFIAFESEATNLDPTVDPPPAGRQVYVRDVEAGVTRLASRATDGSPADADSGNVSISPDGRYVAFDSAATNLSAGDDDAFTDVFLRDTVSGATTLVSVSTTGGVPANGDSRDPAVSLNGAVVAFESDADNVSTEDVDTVTNVFLRDIAAGATALASRAQGIAGAPGDANSLDPSVSRDGRRVAFASDADNLSAEDVDSVTNIYVAEPRLRSLTHVTRTSTTGSVSDPANGSSREPVIAEGGSHVAFTSLATNLAAVAEGVSHVYVRDLSARTTTLASRADSAAGGTPGNADSSSPALSGDGLQVAFQSDADNLHAGTDEDACSRAGLPVACRNVFVHYVAYSTTSLFSRASGADGAPGNGNSFAPALSRRGDYLAFASDAANLTPGGNAGVTDVFLREVPFVPPPPPQPPDLGGNDHGGHGGEGGQAHDAGHAASGAHGGHTGANHFRLILGSLRGDRIFGTPTHDKACGGSGDDVIVLGSGSDVGYGGECGPLSPPANDAEAWWRVQMHEGDPPIRADGKDELKGRKGEDALYGGGGDDRLVGGSGRDLLVGGPGADRLVGGPGKNRYLAGSGNDSVNSANGVRELVDCGFGRDRVRADRRDILSGCELVRRVSKRAREDIPELLPECPGGGHECHSGETIVLSKARR